MRHLLLILAVMGIVETRRAEADIIASAQGATDPTTEGFSIGQYGGSSTGGPLANDLGLPAWSITGSAQSSQYAYFAPGLTSNQLSEIAGGGFTMTMVARVLPNGLAPAYSSGDPATIGASFVCYAGVRWEIDLGLNSNGDTVVVLPTTLDNAGPGQSIRSFGPNYTLTGSGSTYHTYQLEYNPTTQLANVYVDGAEVLSSYSGNTSFYSNTALVFAADSGGEGNFNFVEVETGDSVVPEPGSLLLLGIGAGAIGIARRRRKVHVGRPS